ncbi:hypothetical protein L6R29_10085 [Myxococcota bacterium]|nr:hypothetical protein [Myxococcota bacterium]
MAQERSAVRFGGWAWVVLWLGASTLSGCQSPCRELALKICMEMRSLPRACRSVREAAESGGASTRQCRALLATWRTYGRLQVAKAQGEFVRYETWLFERKDIQSSLQELERAELSFARRLEGAFRPGAMIHALHQKRQNRSPKKARQTTQPPRQRK